jgi:hypothetical protein
MIRHSEKNRIAEKKFQTLLLSRRYVGGKSRGARVSEDGLQQGKWLPFSRKKLSLPKVL